jgi:hypothetical protein
MDHKHPVLCVCECECVALMLISDSSRFKKCEYIPYAEEDRIIGKYKVLYSCL